MDEEALTELFRKLGARDPQGWAHSQTTEGIPQLARFLFLRQAWRRVIADGDTSWIEEMSRFDPTGPGGAIGPAINRLIAAGGRKEDIATVVRVMQWYLLARLCVLLDDPGQVDKEVADLEWGLFALDENGVPTTRIEALIESVLETDPTGREMRPAADR